MSAHVSHNETRPDSAWQAERFDRDACGCECALPFLTDPLFAPCVDQPARRDAASIAEDA